VIYYDCQNEIQITLLYEKINNINHHNVMLKDGKLNNQNGLKLKEIHEQLKKQYGPKIWDDKRLTKPYVNKNLLDGELNKSKFINTKSVDDIMTEIKLRNETYKKIIEKEYGGFCLQYDKPKARWVQDLFS
jgi:hypothetical protein